MDFHNVNIYLIINDTGTQDIILSLLASLGFKNIQTGTRIKDMRDALNTDIPDLIIVGSEFPNEDIHRLVCQTRHNKIGLNPFTTILAVMNNPSAEVAVDVINSGVDDVFLAPFSRKTVELKLENLVVQRKPFVVTSKYIGPDRRSIYRSTKGAQEIERFHVPNSLKSRVTGTYDQADLIVGIEKTIAKVNSQRLDRYGFQISWLINRILFGYNDRKDGRVNSDVIEHIDSLSEVVTDTAIRIDRKEFEDVYYLCETLLAITERMNNAGKEDKATDLELLPELGRAFKMALSSSESAAMPN